VLEFLKKLFGGDDEIVRLEIGEIVLTFPLMGIDHERLSYRYAGLGFRLTNVYVNVMQDLIAYAIDKQGSWHKFRGIMNSQFAIKPNLLVFVTPQNLCLC
jgi:hypothetical protein